jgi:hypothetical protein
MWVVLVVQIVLSIATLAALFITIAWLQSSVREGRETKRLLENLSAVFNKMVGTTSPGPSAAVTASPAKARRGGAPPAPVELESMTEPQRRQALTVEMVRPTVETPRPLAVKLGTEVVELDAETIARIEALKEDVNAERTDGRLLQRVIEAGLDQTEQGDRVSREVQREPEAHDAHEPTKETPTTPKKPTGR